MFQAVATAFQKIVTDLDGADSEVDRILDITKIVLKLIKQNGH
jgi:hypothetical protein